jgi:uncharacterized repeat protein (TIGR01451 family)
MAVAAGLLGLLMIILPVVVSGNGQASVTELARNSSQPQAPSGSDFVVVKELADPPSGIVVVGEELTFTIWITNVGTSTIISLTLADIHVPDYLAFASSSVPTDGQDAAAGIVTWTNSLTDFLPLAQDEGFSLTVSFYASAPTAGTPNLAVAQGLDDKSHLVGPKQGSDQVVITQPGLTVVKELADPAWGVAALGETVTFTLWLTNNGTMTIASLSLVDLYDPGYLSFTASSVPTDGQQAATGVITWTGGLVGELPLAPGEAFSLTAAFRAEAPTAATPNVALAQGLDDQGLPVGPEQGSDTVTITEPGLTVVKELADPAGGVAAVGEMVTFTLWVTNSGDTSIASLSLVDDYDPGYLSFAASSVPTDGQDAATGVITWTDGLAGELPLAPGQGLSLTAAFRAEAPTAGTPNVALAYGEDEHGHSVGPEEGSDAVTITEPGLTVVKELADPVGGVAAVGETVTFTLWITNSGDTSIASLSLVDDYDPGYLSFAASSVPTDGQDTATGVITWTGGLVGELPLAPGEGFSLTASFLAHTPTAGTANWARARGEDEHGHSVGPEQGSDAVAITEPGLTVVKELSDPAGGAAAVGETVTFTLWITNSGDTAIASLSLTDSYDPEYLALTSSSVPADGQDAATGVITWSGGLAGELPLAPDMALSLTVSFLARAPTVGPAAPEGTANWARAQGEDEYGHSVGPEQGSDTVTIRGRVYLPLVVRAYRPQVLSWHQGTGTAGLTVYSLATCPGDDPNVVYAGTKQQGVYRSGDGGVSWQPTALTGEMVWDIAVQPDNCQVVYATTWGRWVLRTEDGGNSWSEMNNGLGENYLLALALDPDNYQVIYAGTYSQGVYKSINRGDRWSPAGLFGMEVTELAIDDRSAPKTIHAGTWGDGVHSSPDDGMSWLPADGGLTDPYIYALAVDPAQSHVVYAATWTQGVFRSEDTGVNWVPDGLPAQVAYSLVVEGSGIAYAGRDGTSDELGVFMRLATGVWQPMTKTEQLGQVAVRSLALRDAVLLAGTTGGVWWYGPD